ncbi:alcohol dehydrogenase catalytic domain-containing protein [Rhodococcus sp. HM1]|uniref:zinc-dependent alcohol dehydrogenase n=1 Tax=Rhodococcus sp. HM1 TaxID=2937759 RepID=UPI00200B2883|nr:alcohol dehydrogenase catalytic domain-containing protein [Rhodococcus sp. HM1]MCK8673127.1 alcohol dehydrogenase catalytic domain-containing protein [Rhodococcus sp. HM1]
MSDTDIAARVLTAPRRFETRRFDRPVLGADDGLLGVLACGLCGSDVASWRGEKKHDGPVVLGHEVIGRIADLGPAAAALWDVRPGDRVAIEEAVPCMFCALCRSGHQRLCTRSGIRYGYTSTDTAPSLWGGFAPLMYLHPRTQLHRVPDSVSDELATLYIPLSNGLAWMGDSGELRPGERVAIFGAGQHGIASAAAALRLGASEVVVVGTDRDGDRLAVARELGSQVVVAPAEDVEEAVVEVLGGSPDIVMDMTPSVAHPVEASIRLAAVRGRVLWGGMKRGASRPLIDTDLVAQKELTVRGLWARPSWAITAALRWLASEPALGRLCERTYRIDELDNAFVDAAGEGSAPAPLHTAVLMN